MHLNDIHSFKTESLSLTTGAQLDKILVGVTDANGRATYVEITKDEGIALMEWLSEVTM
jgi:hypothetical protein